jgi:osmotically-inducible protein OsmY
MKHLTKFLLAFCLVFTFLSVAGCGGSRHMESTGGYIDDSVITAKVKSAIVAEPTLSAFEINVETYKGVVQLSGFVDSQSDITRASSIARTIDGVVSVKNDIRLK